MEKMSIQLWKHSNPECMFQDQPLRDVTQRLDLFEMGAPARNQKFHCNLPKDELILSSLLT